MHALAEAEEARAELNALQATLRQTDDTVTGHVVYERPSDIADYEFAVASLDETAYAEGYSKAI